jgi:hypothetical protein
MYRTTLSKKLIFTPARFFHFSSLSYPQELLQRSSMVHRRQQQEGPDGLRGGEAGPWSLSPWHGGRVPVYLVEGRRWSPGRPPLGSASPQQPSSTVTGTFSPKAHEARPVAPSPSLSCRARSPGALPQARSRSPPRSHIGYLLRYPCRYLPTGGHRPCKS